MHPILRDSVLFVVIGRWGCGLIGGVKIKICDLWSQWRWVPIKVGVLGRFLWGSRKANFLSLRFLRGCEGMKWRVCVTFDKGIFELKTAYLQDRDYFLRSRGVFWRLRLPFMISVVIFEDLGGFFESQDKDFDRIFSRSFWSALKFLPSPFSLFRSRKAHFFFYLGCTPTLLSKIKQHPPLTHPHPTY